MICMKAKAKKETPLTIKEALGNLAILAAIDPKDPYRVGILQDKRFVKQEEGVSPRTEWFTPEGAEDVLEVVKKTFQTLSIYLEELYENPETDWENPKTRKGLQAIMVSVGEAVDKLDQLLKGIEAKIRPRSISTSEEYQKSQEFYLKKLQKKFAHSLEGKEAWEEAVSPEEEVKDFDAVRNDYEYELFYLVNEEGKPYFFPHLLRNIKLTCDFDESIKAPFEEDPLLRIRTMQDRDLSSAAIQILRAAQPIIKEFYRQKIRHKEMAIVQALARALMALMLAADQRNLIQNTSNKSCLEYFHDFEGFLQEALASSEYMKWIAYPPDQKERTSYLCLDLVHVLCKWHFTRHLGIKQEMDGFIHRLVRKGVEASKRGKSLPMKGSLYQELLAQDTCMREILSFYPSGPLFKILDILREEGEIFFEPIRQQNYPHTLFLSSSSKKEIAFLHLPSPTRQRAISKADVLEEFRGLLRSYLLSKPCKKHLLINLQDRTSWKELTRCQALEVLQKQAEFSPCLTVMTLAKNTDFYYQYDSYAELENAESFLKLCYEHFQGAEEYGFFFPASLKTPSFFAFVKELLPKIHEVLFRGAKKLEKQERLDFIEILYAFVTLKAIEILQVDSVSFTCKDGLDTGACAAAFYYGFLHYVLGQKIGQKEQEYLRILFYAPALLVRERAVNPERFNRAISALARFEGKEGLLKAFGPFFESLKQITIQEHPGH